MKFTINLDTTPLEVFETLKAASNLTTRIDSDANCIITLHQGRAIRWEATCIGIEGAPVGEAPPVIESAGERTETFPFVPLTCDIDECGRRRKR